MTHPRKAITGLAGLAVLGTMALTPIGAAQAEPSIDDVQERVDKLYHSGEVAAERYNDARLKLEKLRGELTDVKADQRRQDKAMRGIQTELRRSVLDQFEGSTMSQVTEVLAADDPQEFLASLSSVSTLNSLQGDLIHDFDTQVTRLDLRRDETQKRIDAVADTEADLKAAKDEADGKLAKAEDLLDDLKAEELAELTRTNTSRSDERAEPVAASGRAGTAVDYAMSKTGGSYVYGAAGPSSFDCSGLTMAAWGAAGVSLPHSSSAQYSSGPRVAESDLQPGDLVFYYSPISHVGIYIGNGQIVHAANPSRGILVDPLHMMPYTGAVRPG